MARHRTESERREIVRAFRRSGLSAGAFSSENHVSQTTLLRWAGRYEEAPVAAPAPDFVRLQLAPSRPSLVVEAGRARILVEPGFDPALLRAVVEALGGSSS